MTTLRETFYNHTGNLIHKWDHYFEIYEKYFSKYKNKKVNILEIGISHGGSLQMWKKYFGENVNIFAIDVNQECKKHEDDKIKIFIGSQSDVNFLKTVESQLPELDIILDDGGHTMQQQIVSFEQLYLKVKEGGLYIVEDTHSSYWHAFGGGLKNKNSFIEYAKNLIDSLYDSHISNKRSLLINEITKNIYSISYYDSIVVFEKKLRPKPFHIQKGNETITPYKQTELKKKSVFIKIKDKILGEIDTFKANSKGKII